MNLYRISQASNQGYDTFDAAIVSAETEEQARNINPSGKWDDAYSAWCKRPDQVTVELIGMALPGTEAGVELASFNAG